MRSAFGMIRDAAMRQARARARLAAVLLLALGLAAPAAALEIRAARVLPSGTVLAPSDLQVFGAARAGAHAPARAVAALLGQETQRTILQGMPIATSDVAPPTLVSRNDQVEIVVERGALRIRTFGRALASGARSDVIPVMNTTSRRRIEAVVVGPRRVRVAP